MSSKGGPRHTCKPHVDSGLLMRVFSNNSSLLQNLGTYERISRNQACDPKGLLHLWPLINGLVELEPTCEVHGTCLKDAIFSTLLQDGTLNDTKWSGSVWVGLKVERINVLLYHLRRLQGSDLKQCAAKLRGAEYMQLMELLDKIKKKEKHANSLPPRDNGNDAVEPKARKLGKKVSDVSVDSNGFPNCFGTPASQAGQSPLTKEAAGQGLLTKEAKDSDHLPLTKGQGTCKPLEAPSFLRRRPGQKVTARPEGTSKPLKAQLGLSNKNVKKKKPNKTKNSSLTKGATKTGSQKTKGKTNGKGSKAAKSFSASEGKRMPWTKLVVTNPKKPPWRSYICGTTAPGGKGKLPLILQTTRFAHSMYLDIMTEIKRRLEKDHLTKEEALELRSHLYQTW